MSKQIEKIAPITINRQQYESTSNCSPSACKDNHEASVMLISQSDFRKRKLLKIDDKNRIPNIDDYLGYMKESELNSITSPDNNHTPMIQFQSEINNGSALGPLSKLQHTGLNIIKTGETPINGENMNYDMMTSMVMDIDVHNNPARPPDRYN